MLFYVVYNPLRKRKARLEVYQVVILVQFRWC